MAEAHCSCTTTWLEVVWTDTECPGNRLKDASLSQIKQRSLSVTCGGPQTAKPEENEPPHDPPRCGWQDKAARCLKETRDNEIIFNLCPFEALPAPVILDGGAREDASRIHTKPANYCTNYSLLMRGRGEGECGRGTTGPGSGERLVCWRAS